MLNLLYFFQNKNPLQTQTCCVCRGRLNTAVPPLLKRKTKMSSLFIFFGYGMNSDILISYPCNVGKRTSMISEQFCSGNLFVSPFGNHSRTGIPPSPALWNVSKLLTTLTHRFFIFNFKDEIVLLANTPNIIKCKKSLIRKGRGTAVPPLLAESAHFDVTKQIMFNHCLM